MPYGGEVDMWSCGVLLYVMLSGSPAFYAESQTELLKQVRVGKLLWFDEVLKDASDEAKDLIKALLTVDQDERMTLDTALAHPWMNMGEATCADNVAEVEDQ